MHQVIPLIQRREARRRREERNPVRWLGLGFSLLLSILVAVSLLLSAVAYIAWSQDLPSLATLPAYLEPPAGMLLQPTRIYDRSGEHLLLILEDPAAAGRNYLSFSGEQGTDKLSPSLADAVVAALQPGFWDSPGYRLLGSDGGDQKTIAERLTVDLLLSDESPGLRRELRQRLLAGQAVSTYGHAQVLEWFLNSARFGPRIYGSDAAARAYFGKSASELTLAEAAALAAALQSPVIDPRLAPEPLIERQRQVLEAMRFYELATPEQVERAKKESLTFATPSTLQEPYPAFTALVLDQLAEVIPLDRLERGGYRIITSLDYELQTQVACVTRAQLSRLQNTSGEIPAQVEEDCPAALLLPTSRHEDGDNLAISAAAILLNPQTNQVLAMVHETPQGPGASYASRHPAGTLMTPFLYLTAFTRGWSPASLLWDIPPAAAELPGDAARPQPETDYRGPLRLRSAMANDYLPPAAQVLAQVGAENVWRTISQFGLGLPIETGVDVQTDLEGLLSTEGSLLDVARAFGIFANQGLLVGDVPGVDSQNQEVNGDPQAVLRVEDANGAVLMEWGASQGQSIVAPQLAYLVNHVLIDQTARWPSLGHPNALETGLPAAAKLGASLDGQDAWTVGYLPDLLAAVWLGAQDGQVVPVQGAAGLWHAIWQSTARNLSSSRWQPPLGINQVQVCDPSGMLPTSECPSVVDEVFLEGSEPTQVDMLYRLLPINRQSGRLATVFTPPELVEERVYLIVPPEAEQWAQSAGLPIPPDDYDAIYVPPPASPEAHFTAPQLFDHVAGEVEFWGTADGDDFAFYRLLVGQGLNPQNWLQIGEDITEPVGDGLLGVWDTSELSGLYVVRLMVVSEDQRVQSDLLQLSVDNTPPEIELLSPRSGQTYRSDQDGAVVLHANAIDNLEVERVELYIDNHLVASIASPPYLIAWEPRLGEHTFLARAFDLAGNQSQASLTFSVER